MDVSQKVIEIIAREQHLDVTKITMDSTFAELGIDSLDGVNILFALEEEFKLDIPDTVAQNMKSVRQVVDSLHACWKVKTCLTWWRWLKASLPQAPANPRM